MHTVEGLVHRAELIFAQEMGWMRIEPPVEFGEQELENAKRSSGALDRLEWMATSRDATDEAGGTLFFVSVAYEEVDAHTKVIDSGLEAARILINRADSAASKECFEATFKTNED
ncbi:MAG TPA: hypothetical protein VM535_00725 [Candidatus Saccharimonadales bacterium]|nr:hypothetical protein [Candidatus Saccharimonadales bacterium]